MRRFAATIGVMVAACSGGGRAGLPPLLADPAVETGCLSDPLPSGRTRAKVVACEAELVSGRLAGGRIGDFVLENARVRVIVRGPGAGLYLHGTSGGYLIDAVGVGGDDLLQELVTLVQFNAGDLQELVITEAGDDGAAELTVRGPVRPVPLIAAAGLGAPAPLIVQQTYRLAADDNVVEIQTRTFVDPDGAGDADQTELRDLWLAGGRAELFVPGRDDLPVSAAAPFLASSGTTTSYGLVYPPSVKPLIDVLAISFFRFTIGPSIGPEGEGVSRYFIIGDGSIASVAERAWQLRGDALGSIQGRTSAHVEVEVRDAADRPITRGRSDEGGAYRLAVPPGSYTVTAVDDGRAPGVPVPVIVAAGQTTDADAPAGPAGAIAVTVVDDSKRPLPARVRVTAPGFERLAYTGAAGRATVPVPPGMYSVSVSRGLEYDAHTVAGFTVGDDQIAPLAAVLTRVVATAGWISVDTHLHSEMSVDSEIPLDTRLSSVAAEGVEVAVSSDHDFVVDYGDVVADLGLGGHLQALTGEESSSLHIGHINAWPVVVDAAQPGGGSVPWAARGPGDVFAGLRGDDATRVVQVNHPRDPSLGLFALIDLDRETLIARADPARLGLPGADLDAFGFDAIEVANTKTAGLFEPAFADWLAFVAAGYPVVATGSSDSHGDDTFAGSARTYVWVGPGNDDPATLDPRALDAAILAQQVVVAQGAFVTASLLDPDTRAPSLPGDVVDFSGAATATVRVRVLAPPWSTTGSLHIYRGTGRFMTIPLDPAATTVVRYDQDVVVPLDGQDTFFVVRVDAGGTASPVFDYVPEPSFTNPLYVDRNGNGVFDP